MNYQILRAVKLTSNGAISASGRHTWREVHTPNADPERTMLNKDLRPVRNAENLVKKVGERVALAKKKSTKPVLVIEFLVTASHEAWTEYGGNLSASPFFKRAFEAFEHRFGEENIVAANLQFDEATPHLVLYIVPLIWRNAKTKSVPLKAKKGCQSPKERRSYEVGAHHVLSAAEYLDGQQRLRALQDWFHEEVGQHFGLSRGVRGTGAKHVDIKKLYAAVGNIVQTLPDPPKSPTRPGPRPMEPGLLASRAEKRGFHLAHNTWKAADARYKEDNARHQREFNDWWARTKRVFEENLAIGQKGERALSLLEGVRLAYEKLDQQNRRLKKQLVATQVKTREMEELSSLAQFLRPSEFETLEKRRRLSSPHGEVEQLQVDVEEVREIKGAYGAGLGR